MRYTYTILIHYQAKFADNEWMPSDASGPFKAIVRGLFSSPEKAKDWADTFLPIGAEYSIREIDESARMFGSGEAFTIATYTVARSFEL